MQARKFFVFNAIIATTLLTSCGSDNNGNTEEPTTAPPPPPAVTVEPTVARQLNASTLTFNDLAVDVTANYSANLVVANLDRNTATSMLDYSIRVLESSGTNAIANYNRIRNDTQSSLGTLIPFNDEQLAALQNRQFTTTNNIFARSQCGANASTGFIDISAIDSVRALQADTLDQLDKSFSSCTLSDNSRLTGRYETNVLRATDNDEAYVRNYLSYSSTTDGSIASGDALIATRTSNIQSGVLGVLKTGFVESDFVASYLNYRNTVDNVDSITGLPRGTTSTTLNGQVLKGMTGTAANLSVQFSRANGDAVEPPAITDSFILKTTNMAGDSVALFNPGVATGTLTVSIGTGLISISPVLTGTNPGSNVRLILSDQGVILNDCTVPYSDVTAGNVSFTDQVAVCAIATP